MMMYLEMDSKLLTEDGFKVMTQLDSDDHSTISLIASTPRAVAGVLRRTESTNSGRTW